MLVLTSFWILLFAPVFLSAGSVHAFPIVQTQCNDLRPVICPKYGTCCSGIQFCAEELGTCEECFPLDITTREDRLKLCSQMANSTSTRSMRHYSCSKACYHSFSHGEISDYTEPAVPKTTTDVIQEFIAKYNSSVPELIEKLKLDIINQAPGNLTEDLIEVYINTFNSSVHHHIGKLKLEIKNKDEHISNLESKTSQLNTYAILFLLFAIIASIAITRLCLNRCKSKKCKKTKKNKRSRENKELTSLVHSSVEEDITRLLNQELDLLNARSIISNALKNCKDSLEIIIDDGVLKVKQQCHIELNNLQDTTNEHLKNVDDVGKAAVESINERGDLYISKMETNELKYLREQQLAFSKEIKKLKDELSEIKHELQIRSEDVVVHNTTDTLTGKPEEIRPDNVCIVESVKPRF